MYIREHKKHQREMESLNKKYNKVRAMINSSCLDVVVFYFVIVVVVFYSLTSLFESYCQANKVKSHFVDVIFY